MNVFIVLETFGKGNKRACANDEQSWRYERVHTLPTQLAYQRLSNRTHFEMHVIYSQVFTSKNGP